MGGGRLGTPNEGGFPFFSALRDCACQRCQGRHPQSRRWENTLCFLYRLLKELAINLLLFQASLTRPHCTPRNPLSTKARLAWEEAYVQLLCPLLQMQRWVHSADLVPRTAVKGTGTLLLTSLGAGRTSLWGGGVGGGGMYSLTPLPSMQETCKHLLPSGQG